MSLQVCSCCGWSKVTSYQGLRTHQGKMGCTPKGMSIPESQQFSYLSKFNYQPTSVTRQEPFVDIFKSLVTSDSTSEKSLQVCHCGWSKVTDYKGLRIHQGMMGCTPQGMRIPENKQYIWANQWEETQKDNRPSTSTPVKEEETLMSPNGFIQMNPAANQAFKRELFNSSAKDEQQFLHVETSLSKNHGASDFLFGSKQDSLVPLSQIYSTHVTPPATQTPVKETHKSFFETPTLPSQSVFMTSEKACRSLDFSNGEKVDHLWEPPTTKAQEPAASLKDKQKEEKKETEKQLQAKKDRMKANLQQKIHVREQKMVEIRSSAKSCKASLDTEWLEINNVFSEVMSVVEDARQKALGPLEKRRQQIKREAQALVQKLQREIDQLKGSIDELDKKTDLQVPPLPGLDEPTGWENGSVDTSMSFGTLRATTSTMVKEIQQELENLSSLELKRIQTFAVEVKLDSATAHQCLDLTDDLKSVRDGGERPKGPDGPERFDMFGSVLGLNNLTTGKSYWEVEVNNKTGWDLGVVRRSAGRKGILTVNTDNGYWVTVHYEGKKYAALTVPPVKLSLKEKPQKVGVFVDYEEGLVSFYDVTAQSHMYSFTECLFDDKIVPYFSPHLKGNGKNVDPLIISVMHRQ